MIWLIAGLILWTVAHFFKRIAPAQRESMGNAGAGLVAIGVVASVVLMVVGYRATSLTPLWDMGSWAKPLNNVLMLLAIALFFIRDSKSRLRGRLRHPMLAGFIVWIGAHLLVNGDMPSLVLFGGLGLWAIASILIINRAEPAPEPFNEGTSRGDLRLAIQTVIVFAVIGGIHMWIGPSPFGV